MLVFIILLLKIVGRFSHGRGKGETPIYRTYPQRV